MKVYVYSSTTESFGEQHGFTNYEGLAIPAKKLYFERKIVDFLSQGNSNFLLQEKDSKFRDVIDTINDIEAGKTPHEGSCENVKSYFHGYTVVDMSGKEVDALIADFREKERLTSSVDSRLETLLKKNTKRRTITAR